MSAPAALHQLQCPLHLPVHWQGSEEQTEATLGWPGAAPRLALARGWDKASGPDAALTCSGLDAQQPVLMARLPGHFPWRSSLRSVKKNKRGWRPASFHPLGHGLQRVAGLPPVAGGVRPGEPQGRQAEHTQGRAGQSLRHPGRCLGTTTCCPLPAHYAGTGPAARCAPHTELSFPGTGLHPVRQKPKAKLILEVATWASRGHRESPEVCSKLSPGNEQLPFWSWPLAPCNPSE